jgi:hypothetical protein
MEDYSIKCYGLFILIINVSNNLFIEKAKTKSEVMECLWWKVER